MLALTAAYPVAASAGEDTGAPRAASVQNEQNKQDRQGSDGRAKAAENGKRADGVAPAFKDVKGAKPAAGAKGAKGASNGTKAAWGYQIMPSCAGLEAPIRQGAAYWEGATETPGSGKPVECTYGYIADCFGTVNAVGCNYGPGQMIMLSTRVSDFALLAAHEFGHEWHPHSAPGCMNWASAYEVMRPTIC
ncbi:hypothetical protein DVA86_24250 [Streptomyces armeniacus]|uniref:Uncharacterized protein n=1 Tax=Streptomyces armeniacus TaxID=83291 RepID=A0A345XUH4_9ACTN|nr:hypothetical protein DVA86_24250 [Streptomyces armeniacus]